jgi:hypothetical protein
VLSVCSHGIVSDSSTLTKVVNSHLGGVIVSVLAIGPKVREFKPGRGDGSLRVIKICSMPSFRGEVKLGTPCHEFLQHVKDCLESMNKNTSQGQIHLSLYPFFLLVIR